MKSGEKTHPNGLPTDIQVIWVEWSLFERLDLLELGIIDTQKDPRTRTKSNEWNGIEWNCQDITVADNWVLCPLY